MCVWNRNQFSRQQISSWPSSYTDPFFLYNWILLFFIFKNKTFFSLFKFWLSSKILFSNINVASGNVHVSSDVVDVFWYWLNNTFFFCSTHKISYVIPRVLFFFIVCKYSKEHNALRFFPSSLPVKTFLKFIFSRLLLCMFMCINQLCCCISNTKTFEMNLISKRVRINCVNCVNKLKLLSPYNNQDQTW